MSKLQLVFRALATAPGRNILVSLCAGEKTIGELERAHGLQRRDIIKHLDFLVDAGLISKDGVRGSKRTNYITEDAALVLDELVKWIEAVPWPDENNATTPCLRRQLNSGEQHGPVV